MTEDSQFFSPEGMMHSVVHMARACEGQPARDYKDAQWHMRGVHVCEGLATAHEGMHTRLARM